MAAWRTPYNRRMPADFSLVQKIAIWALPVIFAITVHEAAHGYTARFFGDRTAQMQGRLSLNPLKHIDPVGTLLVPGLLLLLQANFLFGWAKPVPVDVRNLRNPRREMAIVAAAGPAASAAMMLGWGLLLKYAISVDDSGEGLWMGLRYMAVAGIQINMILFVLNLIPLPPLDGGRVVAGLLPPRLAYSYSKIEPYGLIILVVLMATGILGKIMYFPLAMSEYTLFSLLGLGAGSPLLPST